MRIQGLSLFVVVSVSAFGACSRQQEPNGAGTNNTGAAMPGAAALAPVAPPPPAALPVAPPPPALATYDLSTVGPQFAGWTARGIAGCRVMGDMGNAARIACNGRDGFDLAFRLARRDLPALRRSLETGATASGSNMNFRASTPDRLEWSNTFGTSTSYNFVTNYEVGGQAVSCSNNIMMGLRSEESLRQHQEACTSLAHGAAAPAAAPGAAPAPAAAH